MSECVELVFAERFPIFAAREMGFLRVLTCPRRIPYTGVTEPPLATTACEERSWNSRSFAGCEGVVLPMTSTRVATGWDSGLREPLLRGNSLVIGRIHASGSEETESTARG